MDTKNSKFRQGFARKVREVESFGFRKCSRNFLESLLTLQEAKLPRVVAHASRGRDSSYFGLFSFLRAVWLSFNALRSCLAIFALRGCLEK